jgi:hypothetical protein
MNQNNPYIRELVRAALFWGLVKIGALLGTVAAAAYIVKLVFNA